MSVNDSNGSHNSQGPARDALALWDHIFGGLKGLLCITSARRTPEGQLDKIRDKFFEFPDEAEAAQSHALSESEEFSRVHGQGGEGLLRGHPQVRIYEIAVEREAERYYGPD